MRYAVIGAGLAGAATACELVAHGAGEVLLVEQEPAPGMHASGQNAAMIRQVVPQPAIAELAREGAAYIAGPAREAGVGFQPHGSLLLGDGTAAAALEADARAAREAGIEVRLLDRAAATALVPLLEGSPCETAVLCPGDGVVDVAALLQHYVDGARRGGAELLVDRPLFAARRDSGEWRLEFSSGERTADVLIDAAGAWATPVAALAGASPLVLTPLARHLIYTGPLPWVDPRWPFVWDTAGGVYFRPESAGLLLSACDESPAVPGTPPVDPAVLELLADKLARRLPRLADLPVDRVWSGLRTFAADGRFVIGWDPAVEGFFWVAGLGGHGVTTSHAAGRLAARLLLEGPGAAHSAFDPARLLC